MISSASFFLSLHLRVGWFMSLSRNHAWRMDFSTNLLTVLIDEFGFHALRLPVADRAG
ncbi:hypothetical protein [Microbacterium sp. LWH11-1.2]|uniref:hypothetical protein n=1 Tax=Microbacterium sp. LWH11-1.2 TaxID=3135258 RepID=UPI00313A1731